MELIHIILQWYNDIQRNRQRRKNANRSRGVSAHSFVDGARQRVGGVNVEWKIAWALNAHRRKHGTVVIVVIGQAHDAVNLRKVSHFCGRQNRNQLENRTTRFGFLLEWRRQKCNKRISIVWIGVYVLHCCIAPWAQWLHCKPWHIEGLNRIRRQQKCQSNLFART